jgi:REP element-mobilizing transposase RayT
MPYARRDLIDFLPGEYYHLYNRGARHLTLFHDRGNYLFVLQRIKEYLPVLELTLVAYCLMPNHYHWLVRQDGAQAAGLLAQRVFNSYSKAYNALYGRSGTLFEGRYQARHVGTESYLQHLCRYIHGNPVRHGFCKAPEQWPYSNYAEWIGRRSGKLVDRAFVKSRFPRAEDYAAFVREGLAMTMLPEELTYLQRFEGNR